METYQADNEAKELERKRLAAVQSEEDAREAIERKKAEAKEQAISIRQYSLNRAGHKPPPESQKSVDNPLFIPTDSQTDKDNSSKCITETFDKAGKEWRGRSKLQEEREDFEEKMRLQRVQSSRNRMATIYPNKSENETKSKKRPTSKTNTASRKKSRSESHVPTQDEEGNGDDGLHSVSLKNSPYSGRVPKPKPKSQAKKRAPNEAAPKTLKLDNEALKATSVSRKVQAAILSGQSLTTELYQQFQREASEELAQDIPPIEKVAELLKVCILF